MKANHTRPIVSLDSGDPWHLSLVVERVGPDYLCRIHGGDRHIGAFALAQWKSGRAVTDCLVVGRHKERAIAVFAADELCRATHRSVGCVAGIHFDSITKSEIDEICRAARELSIRAATPLEVPKGT
jgi:hypothetical protein